MMQPRPLGAGRSICQDYDATLPFETGITYHAAARHSLLASFRPLDFELLAAGDAAPYFISRYAMRPHAILTQLPFPALYITGHLSLLRHIRFLVDGQRLAFVGTPLRPYAVIFIISGGKLPCCCACRRARRDIIGHAMPPPLEYVAQRQNAFTSRHAA